MAVIFDSRLQGLPVIRRFISRFFRRTFRDLFDWNFFGFFLYRCFCENLLLRRCLFFNQDDFLGHRFRCFFRGNDFFLDDRLSFHDCGFFRSLFRDLCFRNHFHRDLLGFFSQYAHRNTGEQHEDGQEKRGQSLGLCFQ